MIETGVEFIEGLAGMLLVTDETTDELAFRLNQGDVMQPTVLTCEVVEDF